MITSNAYCAHRKVEYVTQTGPNGLTKGWWECAICEKEFYPKEIPTPEEGKGIGRGALYFEDGRREPEEGKDCEECKMWRPTGSPCAEHYEISKPKKPQPEECETDILIWLGYWRDKIPPEAVSRLQDILHLP